MTGRRRGSRPPPGPASAALTTHPTFGYETLRLAEDGARTYAALNAAAGIVAAYCGMAIAQALTT